MLAMLVTVIRVLGWSFPRPLVVTYALVYSHALG